MNSIWAQLVRCRSLPRARVRCALLLHKDPLVLIALSRSFQESPLQKENFRRNSQMPFKDPASLEEFRKSLERRQESTKRYGISGMVARVVGAGAFGASRCLYIATDNSCYVFNCGESSTRLLTETSGRIGKVSALFVTYPVWENIGGMFGLSIILHDLGVPVLNIRGPQKLDQMFKFNEEFVQVRQMRVECSGSDAPPFDDGVLHVTSVSLQESSGNSSVPPKLAAAYIGKGPSKPGVLDLGKCVELNVPAGPLLGELKAGRSVTLADGRVVEPAQICSSPVPGPVFIVVECPTIDFLSSLLSHVAFKPLYESSNEHASSPSDTPPSVIFHFSPPDVMEHELYREWMGRFPSSTTHIIINQNSQFTGHTGCFNQQTKLNKLNSRVFPLLKEAEELMNWWKSGKTSACADDGLQAPLLQPFGPNSFQAESMTFFRFYQKQGLDLTAVVSFDPELSEEELKMNPKIEEELNKLASSLPPESGEDESYPIITILGSASAMPNKARCTSGILLTLEKRKYMILDCGEGTLNQIVVMFGRKKAKKILRCLQTIYVSHQHGDHHFGLISLFKGRALAWKEKYGQDTMPPPLIAILPVKVDAWLRWYSQFYEDMTPYFEYHHCKEFFKGDPDRPVTVSESVLEGLTKSLIERKTLKSVVGKDLSPIANISTCSVRHCFDAYGVRLDFQDGFSLVYSGDTLPSELLAGMGRGCDLLIHEATMETALESEARERKHSTVAQALEVKKWMKAKHCLLTHFSQRYAKLAMVSLKEAEEAGLAYDFMTLRRSDLPVIPSYYPAFKEIFWEHYSDMVEKRNKRKYRDEEQKKRQVWKAVKLAVEAPKRSLTLP